MTHPFPLAPIMADNTVGLLGAVAIGICLGLLVASIIIEVVDRRNPGGWLSRL